MACGINEERMGRGTAWTRTGRWRQGWRGDRRTGITPDRLFPRIGHEGRTSAQACRGCLFVFACSVFAHARSGNSEDRWGTECAIMGAPWCLQRPQMGQEGPGGRRARGEALGATTCGTEGSLFT